MPNLTVCKGKESLLKCDGHTALVSHFLNDRQIERECDKRSIENGVEGMGGIIQGVSIGSQTVTKRAGVVCSGPSTERPL